MQIFPMTHYPTGSGSFAAGTYKYKYSYLNSDGYESELSNYTKCGYPRRVCWS